MILMRFAISVFALTLLGLAVSLGSAQTQPEDLAKTGTFIER